MRKLLTICAILLSLSVSAQWQLTGSKVRYVNGIGIPTKDTAAGVGADSSQILIRPADSSLYVKYKRTWMRVGGGGGSIAGSGTTNYIPKFTSSTAIGNSQIFDNGTAVGIGTTSPSGLLSLSKSGLVDLQFNAADQTVDNKNWFWQTGSPVGTGVYRLRAINDALSNGVNAIRFERSGISSVTTSFEGGNVGIGTTSPSRLLQVNGTSSASFNLTGATNGGYIEWSNPTNVMYIGTPASITSGNNTDMMFYVTSGERMRITSAGNVGIGTASPSSRLDVSGTATATNLSVTTNATVGGDATITGNTRINGLVGINTAPSSYALSFAATGSNIINYTTQSTNNINLFAHSSSQQFGQIGNASGALSGGSNNDMAVGALGASNNLILYTNSAERIRVTSAGRILAATTTDNGTDRLQVNGSIQGTGFRQAYTARTTAYTATTSDYLIDCTTGTFTVTLYAASGNAGRILIIKNSGTGSITVDANASETIDGALTQTLGTQWSRVHIMCDGTNWKIISN